MDASSKQTALFFGFITAAMTAASAQAAPVRASAPAQPPVASERMAERAPAVVRAAHRSGKPDTARR